MYDLCIKNGKLVNSERVFQGNIYVKDGVIAEIDETCGVIKESGRIIDAEGRYVMPGFIDPHSHLNDPGLTNSEDFYTGTSSAAAGGITTVLEHPLTFPLPANRKNLEDKRRIAEAKAVVDFCLWGALTPDNYDEVDKMIDAGAVAFKAFMPYSVEIPQVNDGQLLKHMRKMKDKDILIGIHCENDSIVNTCTADMVASGRTKPENYNEGRPEIAEIEAVNRVAHLAEESGAKVHVVHCSTSKSVDVIKEFKDRGTNISVETCPHYIALDEDDTRDLGPYGICNPPLRSRDNVEDLKKQMLKGYFDFVGSDHATYTFEEKEVGGDNIFNTPAGLTGIQTCFPLLYDLMVSKGGMDMVDFVKLSSSNAAKRFNIYPQKGEIAEGSHADLVIFDGEESWKVEEDVLHYMMKWSPYMGWNIKGKVKATISRGVTVFENDEILVERGHGRFIRPSCKIEV